MAWDFTHLLAKSGGSQPPPSKTPVTTALNNGLRISHICWQNLAEVSRDRAKGHAQLTSARFCQQMCEIPSPCVHAASTSFLLDGGSLPPDFASRCVKSLALALMVFTGFLLDHSSLPPDFARGFVQSGALAFTRYVQFFLLPDGFTAPPPDFASRCVKSLALALMVFTAFCSVTAHFRQILPVDLCNPEPLHSRGTCRSVASVTASRLPPPDFASRCVKSLALALMRYLQDFCSQLTSARFCQQICEILSPYFPAESTSFLLLAIKV